MDDDRQRWDARYRGRPITAPAAPEAFDGDEELTALVPTSGFALDVACGAGAQALWLAERGLTVLALDVSPVAIGLTQAAAIERGLDDAIEARVHDLDHGLPDGIGGVDVLVCQRFRGLDLYSSMTEVLASGGIAVVTVLSAVGADGVPGEFHAPTGELTTAFALPHIEIISHSERSGAASIVVRRR